LTVPKEQTMQMFDSAQSGQREKTLQKDLYVLVSMHTSVYHFSICLKYLPALHVITFMFPWMQSLGHLSSAHVYLCLVYWDWHRPNPYPPFHVARPSQLTLAVSRKSLVPKNQSYLGTTSTLNFLASGRMFNLFFCGCFFWGAFSHSLQGTKFSELRVGPFCMVPLVYMSNGNQTLMMTFHKILIDSYGFLSWLMKASPAYKSVGRHPL